MPTTYNPVFVIALGGTGTTVARRLRERLTWRYGDINNIPFIQFLFIDTDHNNPDAAGPDGIRINPPSGQIAKMIEDPGQFDQIGLKDWIDMEALKRADKGTFDDGAAGVRMFGRLAFLSSQSFQHMWNQVAAKAKMIRNVTETQIKEQLGIDPNLKIDVGPPRIYVVSSSCGGTGAGSFIDMGYVIQHVLEAEGAKIERIGILAIARQDATKERQFTRNTAAVLSELDYFNRSGVVYQAKYAGRQNAVTSREACYNYCYLVSPSGPNGELDFSQFQNRIAEYIYVDVVAQTDEARSRRADFGPDMAEYDLDGYPLRFLTFGVSSIEFPADVCHQACFHRTSYEFAEAWLGLPGDRVGTNHSFPLEPSETDMRGLVDACGVGAARTANDRLLTQLMTVPEDLRDVAGGKAPHDWINEHINRAVAGEVNEETLLQLEQTLEDALSTTGYFTRCVEMNTKRLRNDRWLEARLLEGIVPQVATLGKGPRYALGMVQSFIEGLKTELARIDKELAVSRVGEYTLEDARQAVGAVRSDWLLRLPPIFGFKWINEHAARREMMKPWVMVCETYNRRAEEHVLRAKRQLYAELLDPAAGTLERRVAHLLEYLAWWHQESVEAYARIMARPLDRRTQLLFGAGVVEQKLDLVMKDPETGTRDQYYRGLLTDERTGAIEKALTDTLDRDETRPFTSACPTDAGRGDKRIHLQYIQAIRDAIAADYRRRAAPGRPTIIYDERVIDRFRIAAAASTGLDAEVAQVVQDSMEMAELYLQHPKYGDIEPVNPRDGWWAFFNGAQADNEWPDFKLSLGNAVNAAAGATGVTAPSDSKWRQEIEDSYIVILLRERAAFPTRIIRGYDLSEREDKIQGTRDSTARVKDITAFSRTGVRPQPPSERDIREAEQFFLGAILLGMLQYSQQHQEFSMQLAQAPGAPRRLLVLPTDFGVSVSELAYRVESRTVLGTMIQDRINELGKDSVLAVTGEVKGRIEITDDGRPRTNEMARLGIRELDDAQASVVICGLEAHFGLVDARASEVDGTLAYADFDPNPPQGRRPGYFCRNSGCGIYLGSDVQSVPPRCPNCGVSFVPYTG